MINFVPSALFIALVIGVFYFGWFLLNDASDEVRLFILCIIGVCMVGRILYVFLSFVD
jgi:hypothetical protein